MAGLGPIELALAGGFLLFGAVAALGSRTTKLVLQKLVAHEAATGEPQPVIELVGRQQGVISFLLTLVGISPITDFKVTPDELCCNSTSLFGRQNQSVPLRAISSVAAGVRKPVGYLFVAFVFLVVGVFGGLGVLWNEGLYRFALTLLVFGALAALFIWLYAINKRFFVSIYTQGGPPVLLSLKPNVIEGVPLDLERALQVVKIIRDRVLASTGAAPASAPRPIPAPSTNGSPMVQSAPVAFAPAPAAPSTYEYDDYSVGDPVTEQPESLLQQARDLIKQGKRQDAVSVLREVVLRFPNSSEAGVAKATLEKAGISV
ncbi:MAG: tetratricopeptide repeat protein [Planctomycetota bacterium]